MALDTTIGGAAADSYGEHADFATYAANMGWSLAGDTTSQEANLRRATMFLDREYVWLGYKAAQTQALAWPRVVSELDPDGYTIPSDAIPQPIINAQFELAYLENQGNDLLAFLSGAEVKREKVKAGPVESETEYATGSAAEARIRSVEGLLRGYVNAAQPGADTATVRLARG